MYFKVHALVRLQVPRAIMNFFLISSCIGMVPLCLLCGSFTRLWLTANTTPSRYTAYGRVSILRYCKSKLERRQAYGRVSILRYCKSKLEHRLKSKLERRQAYGRISILRYCKSKLGRRQAYGRISILRYCKSKLGRRPANVASCRVSCEQKITQ